MSEDQKTFFKVVTVGDKLKSYIENNKFSLEYKVGEWVNPIIGKIFVFDTLEHAQNFLVRDNWGNEGKAIYSCEVKNCQPLNSMAGAPCNEDIAEFWEHCCFRIPSPIGTFGADSVKLIEKVA